MSSASAHHLRLVGLDESAAAARHDEATERARLAIIKENRIAAHAPGMSPEFAAGIDMSDPRWVLAMQTQARLQGAVLTPERRDQLLRNGRKLGLRAFEANLVIAIVQDRARTGLAADEIGPALSLVRRPEDDSKRPDLSPAAWPKWLLAVAAAAALATLLVRWLIG